MTKKDFELVARVLKTSIEVARANNDDDFQISEVADRFARVFAEENPRFNRAKFLAAVGV